MSESIKKLKDKELQLPKHNPKTMFLNPTNKYEIQQIWDKIKMKIEEFIKLMQKLEQKIKWKTIDQYLLYPI